MARKGWNLIPYIAIIAVIGVLVLQQTGSIPHDSVGGSMVIAAAFLAAILVVAVYEALTQRRGVLGWIVNILVSFAALFVIAPLGGMIVALLFSTGTSLAKSGDGVMSLALAVTMLIVLFGTWGALQIVNRWR